METYPDVISVVPAITPMGYEMEQRVLISEYEDSTEQRRLIWASPKSKYYIEYKYISRAEKDILVDFYKQMKGPFEAFNFIPPNGALPIIARFTEDPITITDNTDRYDLAITIIEVLES